MHWASARENGSQAQKSTSTFSARDSLTGGGCGGLRWSVWLATSWSREEFSKLFAKLASSRTHMQFRHQRAHAEAACAEEAALRAAPPQPLERCNVFCVKDQLVSHAEQWCMHM